MLAARANPAQELEIRRVEGLRFGLEFALVWTGPMLDLRPEVQTVARHTSCTSPFARAPPGAASSLTSRPR